MTRIDFYSNVPDKLLFACRLTRKAVTSQQRLVVLGAADVVDRFDRLLWTFSALDFLPHCAIGSPLASRTPVLLASQLDESADGLPHHDILLNLGDEPPPLFARFERLLEIVGSEDADRQAGRARFRYYRDRGYPLQTFDQSGTG